MFRKNPKITVFYNVLVFGAFLIIVIISDFAIIYLFENLVASRIVKYKP